jgi:hypothetical protein
MAVYTRTFLKSEQTAYAGRYMRSDRRLKCLFSVEIFDISQKILIIVRF